MKQTAVEYLQQHFQTLINNDKKGLYKLLFEQALEMEKEQIEKTFKQAQECAVKADGVYFKYESFEQYYKETFKSE